MSTIKCIVFGLVAASLTSVHAISDEEKAKIREGLLPTVIECGKTFGYDQSTIAQAKATGQIDKLDPCFLACLYKKSGFMTDKGLLDVETALAKISKYVSAKEDLDKAKQVGDECVKVNEESVSDGEKGCDRAKLMFNCFYQHREKFQY